MLPPAYDLEKIKFATDAPTFEKAIALYERGKVTKFKPDFGGFSAVVIGSQPYRVSVSARDYDAGDCDCYLGKNDTLCKHMVAVAIRAVKAGKSLTDEDKRLVTAVTSSGKLGELSKDELAAVKSSITRTLRYLKSYNGPSRTWFLYQNSLAEGCNRLTKIISDLPVSEQTAKLLVNTVLRIDDKLIRGGIDDSDGTIGDFMSDAVLVLQEYAKLDPACVNTFRILEGRETSFGWEEPLVELVKELSLKPLKKKEGKI